MLTLYAAPQTCALVPLITLEEVQAPYSLELVNFRKKAHKKADFLALNPKGKVPCLLTEEGPLTENVAIAYYLADRFPGLLPSAQTPMEMARILSDLSFCASTLHPFVTRICMPGHFTDEPESINHVKDCGLSSMRRFAQVVEDRLSSGTWWYGDNWSIVDAYVHWVRRRAAGCGFPEQDFPSWERHGERMLNRPAVQRALIKERELTAQT